MQENKKGSQKKGGFPGVFLIFIIGLVIILTIQNLSDRQNANVSFSHQLEHLTNLDLINPAESKKTALNDQLVTFSGTFRDKLTTSSKERYQFIYLLNQQFNLSDSYDETLANFKSLQAKIEVAVRNYYVITGFALPKNGISLIDDQYQIEQENFSLRLSDQPRPAENSLLALRSQIKNIVTTDSKESKLFGNRLYALIGQFNSSKLGVGDEVLKKQLRTFDRSVKLALHEDDTTKALSSYQEVLNGLTVISQTLINPVSGVRFYQLRAVRNFLDDFKILQQTNVQLKKENLKLQKAQENVENVIWYFNNKELSTSMLEKVDHEEYHQWFIAAKKEYEGFNTNQGLSFKAPDQPRNLVLEKTFKSQEVAPNYFSYLFTFLPILLIGLILYFVFSKQMKGMGGGSAMNFGKSPAKQFNKTLHSITFNDVAGIDEAREELEEIVDFLKSPQKFRALGARVPKGVLLVGPPGTGKTLIAKAVAGEAGVPFYTISGSDFVEMFVGVGASRVRDLFGQAKKSAPCIIFIDEIDAVGRHRGAGMGGGHDEREQTLNQLLVEFDGMESKTGIIIIAATNRPDVLDKALLRPGRFDRHVNVELPDLMGRLSILKVHARRIKIDINSNLKAIANRTQGASGADLENLLNEAALTAAKKMHKAVTNEDLNYALEKVLYGKERRSMVLEEEDKITTAWHESGHAYVALVTKCSNQVTKATIIPRGRSLGATHFEPKQNRVNYKKTELEGELAVLMGGRIAEEIINKDISSGAQMDIKMATQLARSMVCQWGMSEKIGLVDYSDEGGQNLMAGFQEREYSDETANLIDHEIKRLVDEGYEKASTLLHENKETLKVMSGFLLEFETLDKKDLLAIIDGKFSPDNKRQELKDFADNTQVEPPEMPKQFRRKGGAEPQTP